MRTMGLVLTLGLMVGCAATQYPYATPHNSLDIARMTSATPEKTFAASMGEVVWVEKRNANTRFSLAVEDMSLVVDFVGTHPDLFAGSTVSVLYEPVGQVTGSNVFGGPAQGLYVQAWAVNGVSGTRYVPGHREATEKWSRGALFAAR